MNTNSSPPAMSLSFPEWFAHELAFFSREDHLQTQGPRVSLFFKVTENPRAPRFEGLIGDVPVSLFLRQPPGRAPFLSIVGGLSGPRARENMGTARVVTSLSGSPRLLVHLSDQAGEQRIFVSVSKRLDHQALLALGLDERRQQSKRAAWEASRVSAVRQQDLEPGPPPSDDPDESSPDS